MPVDAAVLSGGSLRQCHHVWEPADAIAGAAFSRHGTDCTDDCRSANFSTAHTAVRRLFHFNIGADGLKTAFPCPDQEHQG